MLKKYQIGNAKSPQLEINQYTLFVSGNDSDSTN